MKQAEPLKVAPGEVRDALSHRGVHAGWFSGAVKRAGLRTREREPCWKMQGDAVHGTQTLVRGMAFPDAPIHDLASYFQLCFPTENSRSEVRGLLLFSLTSTDTVCVSRSVLSNSS